MRSRKKVVRFGFAVFLFALAAGYSAQLRIKPSYGLLLNNGMVQVYPSPDAAGCSSMRALNGYLFAGIKTDIDTFFTFSIDVRYGTERSRIEKEIAPDNYLYYHLRNKTLALRISPGLILSPRHKLFLGLNIVKVFDNFEEGSGVRNSGYQYTLGRTHLPYTWDFRPAIRYQYKLYSKHKVWLESGLEPSLIRRYAELKKNTSPNFADSYYQVSYSLVMIYLGLAF